jgi:urea transport system permease protein
VNYAKTLFTTTLPEAWYYALGTLFVLVTLFLPRGIMGLLRRRDRLAKAPGAEKEQLAERVRVQTNKAQTFEK